MTSNLPPNAPPPERAPGSFPVDRARAAALLKGPAIALLILSAIATLLCLWGVIDAATTDFEQQAAEIEQTIGQMPEGMREGMRSYMKIAAGSKAMGIASNLLGVVLSGLTLLGAVNMLKVRGWGLALAGVIAAMINVPGVCCCCGLNEIFAIWALIVLLKPEVKAAFS
jgi:hypothetical protein